MKCKFCGTKIKKGEEICPNCSKFVSEKLGETTESANYIQTSTVTIEDEHIPETSAEESEDSVCVFDYKEHILKTLLFNLGIGLFFAIVLIFSFFDDHNSIYFSATEVYSYILVILCVGFSFFNGISTYIQEKKCILTVTDKKIYGTIPEGAFRTEDFEVEIADVVCIEKEGFHGKHANPRIIIVTTENRIEIKASSTRLLNNFKDEVQKRLQNGI